MGVKPSRQKTQCAKTLKHGEKNTLKTETMWSELRSGEHANTAGELPRGQTLHLFLSCFKLLGNFLANGNEKILCK